MSELTPVPPAAAPTAAVTGDLSRCQPAADATVELPAWLGPVVVREVTGDDEFANEKLAR